MEVLRLMDEASIWQRIKDTDQWAAPWPNRAERDKRMLKELAEGNTWIVWDAEVVTAQVKDIARPNPNVWTRRKYDLSERAVYAHRLITTRHYAGHGLGAQLIDWAGLRGSRLNRRRGSESTSGPLTGPFTSTTRRGDSSPAIPAEAPPTRRMRSSKSQYPTQNSRRL